MATMDGQMYEEYNDGDSVSPPSSEDGDVGERLANREQAGSADRRRETITFNLTPNSSVITGPYGQNSQGPSR